MLTFLGDSQLGFCRGITSFPNHSGWPTHSLDNVEPIRELS